MNLKRLFDIGLWLPSRRRRLQEIEEEFEFHLRERTLESEGEGMDPAEARRDAERRFGGSRHYREEGERVLRGHAHQQARASFVEGLIQDVRLAVRLALRTPTITALAVIALALGIGANTAVFSVMEAVLLPSFDHPDAARMVQLNATGVPNARRQGRPVRERGSRRSAAPCRTHAPSHPPSGCTRGPGPTPPRSFRRPRIRCRR